MWSLHSWAVWESAMGNLEDTEAWYTDNGADSEPASDDMTWSVEINCLCGVLV